jgi:hypothetical protein
MRTDGTFLIVLAALGGIVALCLFGISRIKNQKTHERGHLALSFAPWVHLLVSYGVAFYIRHGFGSWPRSCIDNPVLPMIDGLVMGLVVGLLIIPLGAPLWLGWFIIRLRRQMKRYWIPSLAIFVTGIVMMVTAQVADPWGFWAWVWD